MIEKLRPDVLTLFLWPFSLAQSALTGEKSWYVCHSCVWFLNCEITCDLRDVPTSINDRKTAARSLDTIHDILWSRGLAQSLLKGQNTPVLRNRNRGVKLENRSNLSLFYWKIVLIKNRARTISLFFQILEFPQITYLLSFPVGQKGGQ